MPVTAGLLFILRSTTVIILVLSPVPYISAATVPIRVATFTKAELAATGPNPMHRHAVSHLRARVATRASGSLIHSSDRTNSYA
ncbi:hypothetical protein K461DRAFT_280104 [Myriangium duriaei CBS 260.36]|uniref:Uncharacterized protein n=1 Tax=Myriangium duriaei CBS 260.36 TaxID=1168546 RepID=A0A9P4IWP4_9PEZI|nr:hypothetical protein K461DRAFT_280104 [Myriangium duriaei CBS 260.36]